MKKYDKKSADQKREEIENNVQELLKNTLKEYHSNPELFAEAFAFSCNFYQYSPLNTQLIYAQNKGATYCQSYSAWKKMGYNVLSGQHGLKVRIPIHTTWLKINNEEYPSGTKSVDLSTGKYLIEISRKGFEDFSKEIEIEENKPEMDFEAVLTPKKETVPPQSGTHTPQISAPSTNEKTGTLTVYSSPGWAKVYIDGEYKGITPVMANLTYGDHYVKLTLDGYDSIGNHIDVNSPDQSYTGKFE